jgi:hypothetical protein
MKAIRFFLAFALIIPVMSCNGQQNKKESPASSTASSDKIEAYYFHFTARCTTCKTIEAKAKEYLETGYPERFKNGLITFQSVNLDESTSKPLAERLGVTGQTLLLVRGDQKINLTNEGFLYAVAKPEKFKEVIREKVDFLSLEK